MSRPAIDLPPASFIADSSKETLQEMRQKAFDRVCELRKQREEIETDLLRWDTIAEAADWLLREREGIIRILGSMALGQIPELFRAAAQPQSVSLPAEEKIAAA